MKLGLFAILVPALPFMGLMFVGAVRTPDWFRSTETVLGAVVSAAAAVFVLAFLIWLPFSPYRWRFEEVPATLRIPMLAGLAVFAIGGLLGLVYAVPGAWRRRDRRRAAEYLVALGVLAWIIVSMVSRGPSA